MVKATEEVDKDVAIQLMLTPDLDGKELSEVIECSLMGTIVDKNTKEPLKLSNEVVFAGLRNRINQIIAEAEST